MSEVGVCVCVCMHAHVCLCLCVHMCVYACMCVCGFVLRQGLTAYPWLSWTSLCNSVDQGGIIRLKRDPPASACRMLGLKVCATPLGQLG